MLTFSIITIKMTIKTIISMTLSIMTFSMTLSSMTFSMTLSTMSFSMTLSMSVKPIESMTLSSA